MGALTEIEIFGAMEESMRKAAEACDRLANGCRGGEYVDLRKNLKLAEGACRQASQWREDTRWLNLGIQMAEAHKRAGDWLRAKEPSWRFRGLAQILRQGVLRAHSLKTKATGTRGMILPDVAPAPFRENKPMQVILPEGYSGRVH